MQAMRKLKPQIGDNFILVCRDWPESIQPEREIIERIKKSIFGKDRPASKTHPLKIAVERRYATH
jgi:hypothetical protein